MARTTSKKHWKRESALHMQASWRRTRHGVDGTIRSCKRMLIVLLCQGACTYSETVENGTVIARQVLFGIASRPTCGDNTRRIRSKGLGIEIGTRSLQIGYASSDLVCLPPDGCAAIFFTDDITKADRVREAFPGLAAACLDHSEASRRKKR